MLFLTSMYTLKKSLGQHFLREEAVCDNITQVLMEEPFDRLLEVGPGGGALTRYLLNIPNIEFKAVEIDREKVAFLSATFPQLKQALIEDSILDITSPFTSPFTLVGNFPYNISTQIVFRVLEWRSSIERMIGMFQKEVAQRICAGPGSKDYGILSVLSQAYFETSYRFDVRPECFDPPPKVMSGVIVMKNIGNPYGIRDHEKFVRLVKAAFGQRRKQLRNPLKPYFDPSMLQSAIFSKRAEQLSVADFVMLLNDMK